MIRAVVGAAAKRASNLKVPRRAPVAVVTGAGSANGIGAAFVKCLLSRLPQEALRPRIAIHYHGSKIGAERLAMHCEGQGVDTLVCQADLSNEAECEKLIQTTIDKWEHIDFLVHSAGTTMFPTRYDELAEQSKHFEPIMAVNVMAPFHLVRYAADFMQKGSAIGIVSSMAGKTGVGSSVPYAVSKAAANGLTLALAKALSPKGIRVNAVLPSVVDSTWWEKRFSGKEEQLHLFRQKQREASPTGKMLTPEDIALALLRQYDDEQLTGELLEITPTTLLNAEQKNKASSIATNYVK